VSSGLSLRDGRSVVLSLLLTNARCIFPELCHGSAVAPVCAPGRAVTGHGMRWLHLSWSVIVFFSKEQQMTQSVRMAILTGGDEVLDLATGALIGSISAIAETQEGITKMLPSVLQAQSKVPVPGVIAQIMSQAGLGPITSRSRSPASCGERAYHQAA